MAKRFTDNEKWKDAWFMDLPSKYKLFWLYILDECNHAGIWKVNFKVASFHIGEHLEYSEVKRIMKSRILLLNDEYWYIKKFIKYQYKCEIQGLNPKNKAHLSTIKLLNEYNEFKPLTSPLLGVKDKDKDKDKDINTDYKESDFLSNWNEARTYYTGKESNINKLKQDESGLFWNCSQDYKKEDFHNAIKGLFSQERVPVDIMKFRPKHLLENIETYLDAQAHKNYKLYV